MIKIKSDKIIVDDGLFDGYIYIENDKIVEVSSAKKQAETFYDYTGKYVSPGFIETHTHGAGGYCFINNTVDDVVKACNTHLMHGTTSILPTVTTAKFDVMAKCVENISKAKKSKDLLANLIGAHLEGPYLSPVQVGAQCPDFITPPNKDEYIPLIEKFGKDITRWTYAPEEDANAEFCKYLSSHNVIPSAGHTNATYADMKLAIKNGLQSVTHLYSLTSTITRKQGFRILGVIETAYLEDDIFVEIIADGKHLPPELIKMIVKIKGADKTIAVTDSLQIAGTNVLEGNLSGIEFIVEEGVCRLKDRSAFAGSIATSDRLLRVLSKECGYSIPVAVKMLTKTPNELLKLNKGEIKAGKDADIIVFDDDICVSDIFVMGKKVK